MKHTTSDKAQVVKDIGKNSGIGFAQLSRMAKE